MQIGSYTMDSRRHVLSNGHGEVQLSPLAIRFLGLLSEQPDTVVERARIIDALWRGDWLVGDPALNRLVSEIRRAVGDDPRNPKLIQTVPRRGYQLVVMAPAPQESEPEERAEHLAEPLPAAGPPPVPRWREVWGLVNRTLIILFVGVSAFLGFAAIAHN